MCHFFLINFTDMPFILLGICDDIDFELVVYTHYLCFMWQIGTLSFLTTSFKASSFIKSVRKISQEDFCFSHSQSQKIKTNATIKHEQILENILIFDLNHPYIFKTWH